MPRPAAHMHSAAGSDQLVAMVAGASPQLTDDGCVQMRARRAGRVVRPVRALDGGRCWRGPGTPCDDGGRQRVDSDG